MKFELQKVKHSNVSGIQIPNVMQYKQKSVARNPYQSAGQHADGDEAGGDDDGRNNQRQDLLDCVQVRPGNSKTT